ncbi:MAG: snoaL-like domain protein [Alphaproteobacteria bacterium]|nr:snoaL-like domain protein [Alphaproteobacteria bacterium]
MTIEDRIARLEAESQIRQLAARYCFYLDRREVDLIGSLFTADATVRSADGAMNATGTKALIDLYLRRFEVLGPGQHVTHDHQIDFVGDGREQATGRVSGHAEVARNGRVMIAATQCEDVYRNTPDGWKIADRLIRFLYYVPAEAYATVFLSRNRNHAYGEPTEVDFPESLPSWISFEESRRQG